MSAWESVFFWSSALILASVFFLSLMSVMLTKAAAFKLSRILSWLALATLTIFGALRWINSGHPPFVTLFESMVISVWFMLLFYQILTLVHRRMLVLLIPVSAISFLMLGWASSRSMTADPLSLALENTWLFIHASFATAGAAVFLIAASLGGIYLSGEEKLARMEKVAVRVPQYDALPKSIYNLLLFGLVLWGVMIVSGSIWAQIAWGRYWAWDPIELWSLISWLLYGLVAHSRMAFKISQRTFSWLTIVAVFVVIFTLWGVNYLYETIHTYG